MPGPASRKELLVRFVLDSVCDDYEHLTVSILPDVARLGECCGLVVEKQEIVDALRELVDLGWAKAWKLDAYGEPSREFLSFPSHAELEAECGAWFYVTDLGLKVELAGYEGWPFDDDNRLRKDWKCPVA